MKNLTKVLRNTIRDAQATTEEFLRYEAEWLPGQPPAVQDEFAATMGGIVDAYQQIFDLLKTMDHMEAAEANEAAYWTVARFKHKACGNVWGQLLVARADHNTWGFVVKDSNRVFREVDPAVDFVGKCPRCAGPIRATRVDLLAQVKRGASRMGRPQRTISA